MAKIVRVVSKFLDNEPYIRQNMNLGLINIRALAKFIIKEKKIDAKLDAVVSAIRRFKLDENDEIFPAAYKMLYHTKSISTRSKLVELSLVKGTEVQSVLPKIFTILNHDRGDILRIIQANETVKLIVDGRNLQQVQTLFPQDKILATTRNLAEINMNIHAEFQATAGVLAVTANALAINKINVIECMTCPPELLWFINEEDILKAYDVIRRICGLSNITFI
jgi:aspartokinase